MAESAIPVLEIKLLSHAQEIHKKQCSITVCNFITLLIAAAAASKAFNLLKHCRAFTMKRVLQNQGLKSKEKQNCQYSRAEYLLVFFLLFSYIV